MSKILTFLMYLIAIFLILLLSVGVLLRWVPDLPTGILQIGVTVACIAAGACMLIPLLVAVFHTVRSIKHGGHIVDCKESDTVYVSTEQ